MYNLQTYVAADRGVARNKIQRMSCGVAALDYRVYTRKQNVKHANIPQLFNVTNLT